MSSDVKELCVFIASPSDLKEERAVLRRLEADLNSKFAPADIRVRMTGWEERPPTFGRPQAQINPMVDACDLFIGLLRRKWGSHTGTHDSGFGEEFERALERRQTSGAAPEISLFFAQLSQDEIDDAGPDLTRVLAFQERIRAERIGIYSTFVGPDDLGVQVEDLLQRHLINLVVSRSGSDSPMGPEAVGGNAIVSAERQIKDAAADDDKDDARSQLAKTLDSLQDLLSDREPTAPIDRDRLELLGAALSRDEPVLGTHLANRLYQRRNDLQLIVAEHSSWVRTLLSDIGRSSQAGDRVIPGWAIIEQDHDTVEPLMVGFALQGGSVGVGAIRSMLRFGIRPSALWPQALQSGPRTEDGPGDNGRLDNWTNLLNRHKGNTACMSYLLQDLDTEDADIADHLDRFLAALQHERGDLNEESRQFIERSRSALAGNPLPLAEALGYSSEGNAPWRLVLREVERLDPKRLNQWASQKFNKAAKMASLRAGIKANSLSESTLKSLLFEDDPEVTEALLEAARTNSEIARHYLSLLEAKPEGQLKPVGLEAMLKALCATREELQLLDAEDRLSNVPWEALTYLDPEGSVDRARRDLQTDLSEFRDSLLALLGEEHVVIDFLAEDRKRVAAALLARRADRSPQDAQLVLQWFEERAASDFTPDYAFDILENVADETVYDKIPEILNRHQDSSGIRLAYDRIRGPLAPVLAALFIDHEKEYFRAPSMLWHITQEQRSDDELREALYDQSAEVRAVAAEVLSARLPNDVLEKVLADYPSAGKPFWYNVIALLDEHLYAPRGR